MSSPFDGSHVDGHRARRCSRSWAIAATRTMGPRWTETTTACWGAMVNDSETFFTGSVSNFEQLITISAVARVVDGANYYRAGIDGTNLFITKTVGWVVGNILSAKVWLASGSEPRRRARVGATRAALCARPPAALREADDALHPLSAEGSNRIPPTDAGQNRSGARDRGRARVRRPRPASKMPTRFDTVFAP